MSITDFTLTTNIFSTLGVITNLEFHSEISTGDPFTYYSVSTERPPIGTLPLTGDGEYTVGHSWSQYHSDGSWPVAAYWNWQIDFTVGPGTNDPSPIPEPPSPIPAAFWLFGTGLLGLVFARRRVHK